MAGGVRAAHVGASGWKWRMVGLGKQGADGAKSMVSVCARTYALNMFLATVLAGGR